MTAATLHNHQSLYYTQTPLPLQTVLMELHEVGPAKLFDTAGVDEAGVLGEKKRRKVLSVIKVRRCMCMWVGEWVGF